MKESSKIVEIKKKYELPSIRQSTSKENEKSKDENIINQYTNIKSLINKDHPEFNFSKKINE